MIKRGNYLDILERKEVDSVENGTVSNLSNSILIPIIYMEFD